MRPEENLNTGFLNCDGRGGSGRRGGGRLLCCLANCNEGFARTDWVGLNRDLLDRRAFNKFGFASSVADKFAGVRHTRGLGGLPVVDGCVAVFECRTEQRMSVGDHILFLGLVEAYSHQVGPTLLYCQGQYAQGMNLENSLTRTPTSTRATPCAASAS